jgi:hypothetical protein
MSVALVMELMNDPLEIPVDHRCHLGELVDELVRNLIGQHAPHHPIERGLDVLDRVG